MDPSLCLYKGKLKEALTLVPGMSPQRQNDAVEYWNNMAEQLSKIVYKGEPEYQQPIMVQNLPQISADHSDGLVYINSTDCTNSAQGINIDLQSSLNNIPPPSLVNSANVVEQFESENLMDNGAFNNIYFGDNIPSINECKSRPQEPFEDKLNHPYEINPSDIMECNLVTMSNSNSLPLTQDDLDLCYNSVEQFNVTQSVSNQTQQDVDKSSIVDLAGILANDLYCPSANEPLENMPAHNIQLVEEGNLSQDINLNKSEQVPVETIANCNSVINVTSTLSFPKTSVEFTGDIGNGQFDRGPELFQEPMEFSHHNVNGQLLTVNSNRTLPTTRTEFYTQSDRPLQQIQPFNSNSCVYSNNSYVPQFDTTRTKQSSNVQIDNQLGLSTTGQDKACPSSNVPFSLIEFESNSMNVTEIKEELVQLEGDKMQSGSQQHTCEICGKSGFSTKGNLKRHLKAHTGEKPFKCDYCPACFTEKKSLTIHVRKHTGEKPYKCETCGKEFSQTGVLASHMALHQNVRNFDCEKCGKAFRQRSQLKLHLMRHDGIKRLECPTCMAKFLTKGDLERHCRIHTGERPYSCEICHKTFTRQQSLNEHMNRHTGNKPYYCKFCDKTFSEKSACYKHAKVHKRQEPLPQAPQQGTSS